MVATAWPRIIAVAVAAGAVLTGCFPPPAPYIPPGPPSTVVVTTTADTIDSTDGLTSLREAFITASNDNAETTITLSAGAEYRLTRCASGQLVHGGPLQLIVTSDGAARATIRQTCPTRVMFLEGPLVTLERVTVAGGRGASPSPCGITVYGQPECARGAGIDSAAPLVLRDVLITDNRAVGDSSLEGGGVAARSGATVIDSEFTSNFSNRSGGAIASNGALTISGSTFVSNTSDDGGALSVKNGSVTISRSEFRSNGGGSGGAIMLSGASLSAADTVFRLNNSGGGPGAAIWADTAVGSLVLERVSMVQNTGRTGALTTFAGVSNFRIIDSTITDNVATWSWRDQLNRAAGGIATLGRSNITITGSTIAFNTAPAGGGANIDLPPSNGTTVTVRSSIISDPLSSSLNCEANGNLFTVTDSLVSDSSCGTAAATAPVGLGALTSASGAWFRAPTAGSPAIDLLSAPCATASDQRGVARPQGTACDVGAIES